MLEVLSSRRLAEYLANGKHSTVLVTFVATMIFCPLPPTIFWKTCKYPQVRCKAAAGKSLLPFGGHRDGCGGTDVCWLGCDLASHYSIQFSKTRPPPLPLIYLKEKFTEHLLMLNFGLKWKKNPCPQGAFDLAPRRSRIGDKTSKERQKHFCTFSVFFFLM